VESTWNALVRPLEALDIPLEYAWNPVCHLLAVRDSDELRSAHDEALGEVVKFSVRARQSAPVYQGLKALSESAEWNQLSSAQRRVVELRLRDARHAGAALEGPDRERFVQISIELSQMATDFEKHLLDTTKAFGLVLTDAHMTEGWPDTLKALTAHTYNMHTAQTESEATCEHGPWRITLDVPCFLPFMQHTRNRKLRKRLYQAYITRASRGRLDNTNLITNILQRRKEEARLLGFPSYADLSMASKMASDVATATNMMRALESAARKQARREFEALQKCALNSGTRHSLAHWDIPFWVERLREQRFGYSEEELRSYFPLPRVVNGLFQLARRLFGITITPADQRPPVWHPDVRFFKVRDVDGTYVASFYLDPYARPDEKRGGAWMDECLGRRRIGTQLRVPIVYLCCNGTPPVGDTPSMMTFNEVVTLFHEFGHGLQAMLTTVDHPEVAGINGIEWDAVELASQFMENWCFHKETLLALTGHVATGEPIPEKLFDKLQAARTYQAGSRMMRQLEFARTDMELHHHYDPDGSESPLEVHRRIATEMNVLPPLEDDRFLCQFSHVFSGGYAAGYYGYKWAEVLSADAFAAFEEAGLDNDRAVTELGRHFRATVLSLGGSRHPMDVFKRFRGRAPTRDALLRHNGLVAPL
jgi:oligopeptidase A